MPSVSDVIFYTFHPNLLRNIIQWKIWHDPVHERKPQKDGPELKRCFEFLDLTSRSFASVIQELNPELCVAVTLFYLILRGLDTVEDDMSIDIKEKEPLLREFYTKLDDQAFTYDGNGPKEKDRQLLVEFTCVTAEFAKIKKPYRDIIREITKKMGNGMADFCVKGETEAYPVDTVADYELYCHYVAGLVGHGLTQLFVEAKLANPALLDRMFLANSMGLFLQNTNIIRDYREDVEDNRRFWPKEIWGKYAKDFSDFCKPENAQQAVYASSEMIANALELGDQCLFYLAGLRDQSIFNFCAIPQVMAIATLALCFKNKAMFQRNIKMSKGEACGLMLNASNLRSTCDIFLEYVQIIKKKNTPDDPSYLRISLACANIEKFITEIFPSEEAKARIAAGRAAAGEVVAAPGPPADAEGGSGTKELLMLALAVFTVLGVMSGIMVLIAFMAGARFDIALKEVMSGNIGLPIPGLRGLKPVDVPTDTIATPWPPAPTHGEL